MPEAEAISQLVEMGVTYAAGGGVLVGLVVYIKRLFRGLGLESAQMAAAQTAAVATDTSIQHLQLEIDRLAKRIGMLEDQVHQLDAKLTNVRLIALQCYEIILSFEGESAHRTTVLTLLRQIIKDA